MAVTREVQDHYFREARRLGYVARSAFKLMEILEKKPLIRKGDLVLDLGCAPGAWIQVAAPLTGRSEDKSPQQGGGAGGMVIGIDLKKVRDVRSLKFCDRVKILTIEADAFKPEIIGLLREHTGPRLFNVVLSDMMASTSGHHYTDHYQSVHLARRALELATRVLAPGGHFICKIFEGAEYSVFVDECKAHFAKVKGFKPKASRHESTEMYVIAETLVMTNASKPA